MNAPVPQGVDFLVAAFARNVTGVSHALVVSADGLLLALSDGLDRATADQLSAVAAGLSSLTRGASAVFNAGTVEQVIVELSAGYLFVTPISDGSLLTVLAERSCDIGFVGYEMAILVNKVGAALTPALRNQLAASLPR
ncbi:roadblock/LC7 domain-containing protein [Nitriliruptor alkaliphilus]|uniref:roadblock/LC7 domain-containing protein n=1 Tax=Nitriliruptor alkaliphilus TaxID=427918 RepID=UPI000696101C|nr:roadblock/LC7 domain-containing protein [Nitriliruptor alkaliphilus]